MCVDSSLAARTNSTLDEFLAVQKQADAFTAKFNLGAPGRIVTPDLSPVIFGMQALDHLLREVDGQHAALGTRIVALRPTVLALQNGAQAGPQKIAGVLGAIDDFDAQLNQYVGALGDANFDTFVASKQLGAVPQAIQATAEYTQAQLTASSASMKMVPNAQNETAQYLTLLANTRQKVSTAAAGLNSLNFQLFSLKTRMAGLRTQLSQLRKQVQVLASTDAFGAANAAAALNSLMNAAENDPASIDPSFKATCKAPPGSPNVALLSREGVYSLYELPGGFFQLSTLPDASGKTVLGEWQSCGPVSK
jgi:hypothetical protein